MISPVGPVTRVLESGQSLGYWSQSISPVGPVTRVLESGQSMSLSPVGPVTRVLEDLKPLKIRYFKCIFKERRKSFMLKALLISDKKLRLC